MNRNQLLMVEALVFLVFVGLGFTIGSNLGDAKAIPEEVYLPAANPEPIPSLPDGERIILLAGVDRLDTNHPQLESLWLFTYYLEEKPIQFLPIFPSGNDQLSDLNLELINNFNLAVNNDGNQLNAGFLEILREYNYWLSGYLIFDHSAAGEMIDLLGGMPIEFGNLSGEQAFASFPSTEVNPQAALFEQSRMLGQACHTLFGMNIQPDWQAIKNISAKNLITDLNLNQLIAEIQILAGMQNKIECEFPIQSAIP